MNKIIKIVSIILLAVFSVGFSFRPLAVAGVPQNDNLVVQFERTPLFNETNFVPGEGVTRWVKVTNNSGNSQRIAVETINENDPDNFGSQLNLVIKEGTATLYSNTLMNFFNAGETYLSDLNSGTTTQYDFIITFNSGSGNPYQGRVLGFDILVGFQGTEGGLPPTSPGGGGNGGGLPAGLSIIDESVRVIGIGETSVTMIWTTSYPSTSYVIYGTGAEAHTLVLSDNAGTPPKYGYAHATAEYDTSPKVTAHSVTITGLTPATTYYFRAVSHASLAISQQFSFNTFQSTEKNIGEIKGEEPISFQSEGMPPEGGEKELAEKPSEDLGGSLEKGLAGKKGNESLAAEGKKSWLDDLINGGLLAAMGSALFNLKSILFPVLIIFAVLIISMFITKSKREKK